MPTLPSNYDKIFHFIYFRGLTGKRKNLTMDNRDSFRGGTNTTVTANKAVKENVLVEKHEKPSSQPNTYDKQDPNTGNPRDTLLTGKSGDMREMRAFDKIQEEIKDDSKFSLEIPVLISLENIVVNTYQKRPLIMPSSQRQTQTASNNQQ